MGEPVIKLIIGDLFLLTPIWLHAPDLHGARAIGVEIDMFAIRRKFRAIVQTFGIGQTDFLPAFCRNFINIKLPVSFGRINQKFAIGRPAVQIRRSLLGDWLRFAPSNRKRVDDGSISIGFTMMADAEHFPIER